VVSPDVEKDIAGLQVAGDPTQNTFFPYHFVPELDMRPDRSSPKHFWQRQSCPPSATLQQVMKAGDMPFQTRIDRTKHLSLRSLAMEYKRFRERDLHTLDLSLSKKKSNYRLSPPAARAAKCLIDVLTRPASRRTE
jgi:hypothetical protein